MADGEARAVWIAARYGAECGRAGDCVDDSPEQIADRAVAIYRGAYSDAVADFAAGRA